MLRRRQQIGHNQIVHGQIMHDVLWEPLSEDTNDALAVKLAAIQEFAPRLLALDEEVPDALVLGRITIDDTPMLLQIWESPHRPHTAHINVGQAFFTLDTQFTTQPERAELEGVVIGKLGELGVYAYGSVPIYPEDDELGMDRIVTLFLSEAKVQQEELLRHAVPTLGDDVHNRLVNGMQPYKAPLAIAQRETHAAADSERLGFFARVLRRLRP